MPDDDVARALAARVCAGDRQAAAELITHFTPAALRFIRRRLNGGVRRIYDSMDFLQSVAMDFAARVCGKPWPGPGALLGVLLTLVRDKLRRRERTRQTNPNLAADGAERLAELPDDSRGPAEMAENKDFFQAAWSLCRPDERRLLSFRVFDEQEYAAIAARLGISPDAARVRVNRVLQRLRGQLSVAGGSHEP